jgi:hypothetical protein
MTLAITPAIRAGDLFTLEPDLRIAGKPDFMNLRAVARGGRGARTEALAGAGIYGLFLRDRLFYVGIYTGAGETPFTGSVLDRWFKHLTYQTLRSPKVTFCRDALTRILALDGAAAEAVAAAMGGRDADPAGFDPDRQPLFARGSASCTANKARFAARHWDVFGPGNEARMLDEVSFVHARLLPDAVTLALLGEADGKARNGWVKYAWLGSRETGLVETLRPACNSGIDPATAREDVTAADFAAAVEAAFATPLEAFGGAVPIAAAEVDEAIEREEVPDWLPGEQRFRARLNAAGEALLSEWEQRAPAAMRIGFTALPDLRLYLEPDHRVLMRVEPRARGKLLVHARAAAGTCRALGFDAVPEGEGWSRFSVDPAAVEVAALAAVAGASLEAIGVAPARGYTPSQSSGGASLAAA